MRSIAFLICGLFLSFNSQAGSHRTFVSTEGTDSGACGPTTPCRTLDYALSQTNDSGEVVIIKSGGYGSTPSGSVTINQSVSIISEPGVFAALAPTAGNYGVNIIAPGISVAIKGMTINGRGGTGGILMANGTSLDADGLTVTNFPGGPGLMIQTPANVTIKRSAFRDMDHGIQIGYGATLLASNLVMTGIGVSGIRIQDGSSGATTIVTATEALVRCHTTSDGVAFDNVAASGTIGKLYLDRITATNCLTGINNNPVSAGSSNVIALSNSFVTGNNSGLVNASSNTFLSSGNNHVANNGTNTSGSITTGTLLH